MVKNNISCLNESYRKQLYRDPFLKVFLENSNDAIAIFEKKNAELILVNEKIAKLFKCTREEFIHSEPYTFVPEFQPDGTSSKELALSKFAILDHQDKISFNWQQRAKDGSLFFTSITSIRVDIEQLELVIIIHNDLTSKIESEKKIGAEREQFKFLFDNAFDALLLYDTVKQKHTDCNERLLTYFEVKDKNEILKDYFKFSSPTQFNGKTLNQAKREAIAKVKKVGKHRYIWHHVTSKGKRIISNVATMTMTAPNEHIRLSIIKDITAEQNNISALEQSHRELLNSQSIAKMASFRYDVKNDQMLWSDYAYNILGMDPNNAPKRLIDFVDTVHDSDRKKFVELIVQGSKSKKDVETEVRILDSNQNIIHCNFKAVSKIIDGEHIYIGSVQDISVQNNAIIELRETNKKYIDLFDNMYDALLIVDEEGNFNDGNIAAERLLGYSKEELKSVKIADIVHADDKERSLVYLEKLLKDGFYSDYSGRIIRKDGEIRHIQVNSTAIYKDGKFAGSRDIARDFTKLKEAEAKREQLLEELERVNLELKNFAYLVSHDLKAPLRAISSLSTWLIEDYQQQLDQSGIEKLRLIHSRVNRMHNFIDAILEYSKIGRTESKVEKVDLNIVIDDIIELIQPPVNFKILIPKKLPYFNGDRTRLTQLFQNLISNAIKYNDKENGQVKIDWEKDLDHFSFFVEDNGRGIAKKDQERIFQIFQTLQSRDEIESTGIGLTIVKRIVNLFNGEIKVESEIGNGACFKFDLYEQSPKLVVQ